MPQPLYDNPWFMDQVYAYGEDQSNPIPDPSLLERDPSDIMRIMDAMLGPGGYMKFLRDFNNKKKKKGKRPGSAVEPTPTMAQPTPTPKPGNMETYNKRPETVEEAYRRIVGE